MNRLTIRARLTLVYGGLFLVAGMAVLGVTYLLIAPQPRPAVTNVSGPGVTGRSLSPDDKPSDGTVSGRAGAQDSLNEIVQDTRHDVLTAVLTRGGIALGVVGAAAVALGWLIAGRLLQPLQRITETAGRIASAPAAGRGLHERIALAGPQDEVQRLADTFDVMLERLDRSFDSQQRFIANASHELRTPLTLSRALLEVAVRRNPDSPAVQQLGETLLDVNGRQERLIDGLLLLARSEREVTGKSYVDLADIVEHVAPQSPQGTVRVEVEAGEAPTSGNPVLLERLVQNLVENGLRHNVPEGAWVRVTTRTTPDGRAELTVSNTGPVVPRYEIPRLFEPFHRLGSDRLATAPGTGLGLSIVRAVVQAHGGEVLAEPREGGGLVVTVTLPAAD